MKKISSLILTAGALVFAVSCAKEIKVANPTLEEVKMIDITVVASEKPATDAGTKTFIDGTSVKWSDSGEKLKVFEVATPETGDVVTTSATTAEGVTEDSGATMTFGVSLEDKSEGYSSFDYYAVYPSSAYQSHSSVNAVALNTKGAQTPTATNFDATQDLLIAKKIEGETSQATTLEMQFARVVAIGKMTIKNLESTDPITKITFSAKVGESPVALAGRTNFNLETAKPVSAYASNTQDYSIILDYEGQGITANTSAGMVAYFTCYPFAINAETPGSFKVIVETATQTFTKEVNVSSALGLAFNIGKASIFSVDMNGIPGENKAVDLRYAYLDYEDFTGNGGTTSYGNVTANKTHGDSWTMFALATNNAIGVRNNSSTNDSYIKLPDFVEDIKSVVVTLKTPTADKTITLESSATGTEGSIASLTTSAATEYVFDLTGESVKTAFFRCSGFQAQVEKIEVYAGEDNRAALAAPTNVAAALNNDDPKVTNSIDVSWNTVDGAGSYVITLMDENLDITTKVADSSPYTVTGLTYNMEYTITVKAIPSDPYINIESGEADAPSDVTTGSEPAIGAYYEKVSTLSNITEGEYIIVNAGYYLPNAAATSAGPVKNAEKAVTIVNDKVQNVTADMTWTFSGSTNAMTIQSTANPSNYLFVSGNNNNNIRVNTTTEQKWTISDYLGTTGAFTLKDNTNNRFCATYSSGSDWRSYNSYNAANYGDGGRVYLYKLVDNRPEAPISWSAATGSATWSTSGLTSTLPSLSNSESLDVAYASSESAVATINEDGEITIVGGGETTISATFTATPESDYKTVKVSYTLTVTDNRTACETPTFSPAAGEVAADTKVTISCGTAGASIYYTVDGTTPTTSSTLYSSAITIDAAKTVKAIAVKENYKDSEVATAAYTIAGGGTGGTLTVDFENETSSYTDWAFVNLITQQNTDSAHNGNYYGTTDGKTSGTLTTKEKISSPRSITFYITKQSNNNTASSWLVQVSSDGEDWTQVGDTQSASSGITRGTWTEVTRNLSSYSNVYVRIKYDGTTAVRCIDDVSLTYE